MNHPFTDEYIKMAKAAEEIQAMRESFDDGDWIEVQHPEYGQTIDVRRDCEPFKSTGEAFTWLPRLDQLLGMLPDAEEFYFRKGRDHHAQVLQVLMLSKYGKNWDEREGVWYE